MPLVKDDWRDPASWKTPAVTYGAVKDGEYLYVHRKTKSGSSQSFSCSVSEWAGGSEFKSLFEKEHAAGAWLAIGLEPHRVMIRRLTSPLKDKTKSAEIWETLLDAAIPFSIEKCQFTFLPMVSEADAGLNGLAVAARLEDVDAVLAEWATLGMCPDLIFPEELMLPKHHKYTLWTGVTRTLFSVITSQGYLGGGGVVKRDQREKMLTRFVQSREEDQEAVHWYECGPEASEDKTVLEETLASAASQSSSLNANLYISDKIKSLHEKKSKTLKSAFLFLILLLVLAPMLLRHQLRTYQKSVRGKTAHTYEQLVGSKSKAPGQELLLARRFLEERWGDLWSPVQVLSEPQVSFQLMELSKAAALEGLVVSRLELTASRLQWNLLGSEAQVLNFVEYLKASGWQASLTAESDGTWRVSGERSS